MFVGKGVLVTVGVGAFVAVGVDELVASAVGETLDWQALNNMKSVDNKKTVLFLDIVSLW